MLGGMAEATERALPERQFGWWDMFVPPDDDPREQGERPAGERATLERFLRDYRLTLELKCSDLDAPALARRSVEPSDLSLLGLVRHLSDVERFWFRQVLAGQDAPPRYRSEADRDLAFSAARGDPAVVSDAWASWRDEVKFAERFAAEAPDLEVSGDYEIGSAYRGTITLREVLVHMIEEYARHCGHADLLRERIDGRIGQ